MMSTMIPWNLCLLFVLQQVQSPVICHHWTQLGVPLFDKMGHFAQYCTNIFGRSTIPVTPVPEPIVLRSHPLNKNSLRQTSRPISNVPFYKLICKRCRKMGHLAKSCPNTPPPSMNKIMCSKCDQFGHYAYNCHVTKTPLNSRYADN
jgi:hypothetical protein